MKVCVVTPTLGASPWLGETVASVAALPLSCGHVLVAPPAKTRELAAQFPQIHVIPERGDGMYAAINAGAAAAGEWDALTYINDDDLLLPEFARVVRVAQVGRAAAQPLIAYGGVRLIDGTGQRLGGVPISPYPGLNRRLYEQGIEPLYQHGTLISRAAWERLGGFDPSLRLCGDSELLLRAALRGVPFVCATRREVAAFRLRPEQLSKGGAAMQAERALVRAKHGLETSARTWRHLGARGLFRLANAALYLERVRRHGWISMAEVNQRAQ